MPKLKFQYVIYTEGSCHSMMCGEDRIRGLEGVEKWKIKEAILLNKFTD